MARRRFRSFFAVIAALLVAASFAPSITARAAFSQTVSYQGKLADSAGAAVADGTYAIVFALYTASSGGVAIWTENRTGANEVTVTDGLFSVRLGDVSSLAGVNWDQELWLGVTVEADAEMTPRKPMAAVPAAFVASTAKALDATYATSTYSTTTRAYVSAALGVGTTSPGSALAIVGTTTVTGGVVLGSSIRAYESGAAAGTLVVENYNSQVSSITLKGTDRSVTISGQVNQLHVAGSVKSGSFEGGIPGYFTANVNSTSTDREIFSVYGGLESDARYLEQLRSNGDYAVSLGYGAAAPAEALRIQVGTGNVGVATTSPGSLLSVGGVANFTAATSSLYGTGGINLADGCFAIDGVCVGGSGSGTVNSGTTGQMPYYAADGTAVSATSSVFLSTAGRLGVGTTSPYATLSVHAADGGTAGALLTVASSTATATTTLFTILSGGNVGVGTSSPYSLLSVAGVTAASSFVASTAGESFVSTVPYGTTAGTARMNFYAKTGNPSWPSNDEKWFSWSADVNGAKTELMKLYAVDATTWGLSGNIFIAPAYLKSSSGSGGNLQVQYATLDFAQAGNSFYDITKVDTVYGLRFMPDVADASTAVGYYFNTSAALTTTGAKLAVWANDDVDKAYIDKDGGAYFAGSVGVGTTTPGALFGVHGGALFAGTTTVRALVATSSIVVSGAASSTFANGIDLADGCFAVDGVCVGAGGPGSGTVNSGTTGQTAYYAADGTAVSATSTLFLSSASRVGVGGTTTPTGYLSVQGNDAPLFYAATSSTAAPALVVTSTTTGPMDYARVAVGTSSPWGSAGLLDQLTVSGRIYSTWRYASCEGVRSHDIATGAIVISTPRVCGDFSFVEDTDGQFAAVVNSNPPYLRLQASTVASLAANEGAAFRYQVAQFSSAVNPVVEALVRAESDTTNARYHVGIHNGNYLAIETNPTAGAYFQANPGSPEWVAMTISSAGNVTYTTTTVSVDPSNFQRLRVELTATDARFYINGTLVATHTSNIPGSTSYMTPIVAVLLTSTDSVKNLDVSSFRFWWDDPPASGYAVEAEDATEESMLPIDLAPLEASASTTEAVAASLAEATLTGRVGEYLASTQETLRLAAEETYGWLADGFFGTLTAIRANVGELLASAVAVLPGGTVTVPEGAGQVAGASSLPAGATSVTVYNEQVRVNSKIIVTPTSPVSVPLVVVEKNEGVSFTVSVAEAQDGDVTFDWLVIQSYAPAGIGVASTSAESALESEEDATVFDDGTGAAAMPIGGTEGAEGATGSEPPAADVGGGGGSDEAAGAESGSTGDVAGDDPLPDGAAPISGGGSAESGDGSVAGASTESGDAGAGSDSGGDAGATPGGAADTGGAGAGDSSAPSSGDSGSPDAGGSSASSGDSGGSGSDGSTSGADGSSGDSGTSDSGGSSASSGDSGGSDGGGSTSGDSGGSDGGSGGDGGGTGGGAE